MRCLAAWDTKPVDQEFSKLTDSFLVAEALQTGKANSSMEVSLTEHINCRAFQDRRDEHRLPPSGQKASFRNCVILVTQSWSMLLIQVSIEYSDSAILKLVSMNSCCWAHMWLVLANMTIAATLGVIQ